MYIVIGILAALMSLLIILDITRRRRIIRRICRMPFIDKLNQLNEFIEFFGFEYLYQSDIFTSLEDAPQRDFGYMRLFDKNAPGLNMVFDSEPVYFNYRNKTWLIQFWKGQYGINTGAEIGIYCADKIVPPERLERTQFRSASNDELLYLTMELRENDQVLFENSGCHWWLTGFVMGHFAQPDDLSLEISISFPDKEMLFAFSDALQNLGYSDLDICDLTLCFTFTLPRTCQLRRMQRIRSWISQLQNRLFRRMYLRYTRPFLQTLDRMLYLRAYIPFSFRKMTSIRYSRRYTRRYYR